MGDFVGGLLKYVKRNPVERVTIAGGFAKLVKLSQGAMDLHWSQYRGFRSAGGCCPSRRSARRQHGMKCCAGRPSLPQRLR